MKTFNEWKDFYLKENPKDLSLDHSVLMKRFNDYIKENLVSNKGDKIKEHKVYYENTKETKLNDPAKAEVARSDNFQPILHKLDEIHSTMKQINWGIRVGFLFIMLVVTGIIKPGIFG